MSFLRRRRPGGVPRGASLHWLAAVLRSPPDSPIGLHALPLRLPQRNHPLCQPQLPRIVIPPLLIPPARKAAQQRLAPGRSPIILHGRKAAAENSGEVRDPLPDFRREPRRVLVADVADPARLRPFFRRRR